MSRSAANVTARYRIGINSSIIVQVESLRLMTHGRTVTVLWVTVLVELSTAVNRGTRAATCRGAACVGIRSRMPYESLSAVGTDCDSVSRFRDVQNGAIAVVNAFAHPGVNEEKQSKPLKH